MRVVTPSHQYRMAYTMGQKSSSSSSSSRSSSSSS